MVSYFQVDALERDALKVLCPVRSMRNTFAPVNRTPSEVLSPIPDHLESYDKVRNLIILTHVCRGWREIFISRPSLWTRLDIERSKSAPLEIRFSLSYQGEAFLLTIPHIPRLKTLSVYGDSTKFLPVLVERFSRPLLLLDELYIHFPFDGTPTLPDELFNGNISSVRELTLACIITSLHWRNLPNLTTFNLRGVPEDKILSTQLLNFFESAPHLRYIRLHDSLPISNAPTERVVPLPHLKYLDIATRQARSVLDHLSIPAGASPRLGLLRSKGCERTVPFEP